MKFTTKLADIQTQRAACAVIGIHEQKTLHGLADRVDKLTGGALRARQRKGDLTGKESQTLVLFDLPNLRCERLLIVGCGKRDGFDAARYRKACTAAANALKAMDCPDAMVWLAELEVRDCGILAKARHLVEAMDDALYRFDEMKSKTNAKLRLRRIDVAVTSRRDATRARAGVRQGTAIGAGVGLARDLANLPGNVCTPSYLARRARQLGRSHGLRTTVLDQRRMEQLGMGALLSVARGSRQPPKLIIMEYRGGKRDSAPIALVGKGLTFDAGGISLKPPAKMDEMKYDMCGGSSVFGAMLAAASLKLPLNVVGIIPSSENLPDGNANKPGDIVTSMSGQTVEILNTDAEGRLILCDALTYCGRYKPDAVIDIATLTGACVVALGEHASGLMTNDENLAAELLQAGQRSLDRAWRLPIWEDYQSQLDSNFADMANVGGRDAGAITAGCFLARFTKDYKWAHLDIAGTAWHGGKNKGATGRVVPLLTQFLIDRSGAFKTLD